MRLSLSLKSRDQFVQEGRAEKVKTDMELALGEIDGVVRSVFDVSEMKIDLESDDKEDDFDIADVIRAIQESGKFQVIGVS